MSMSTRTYDGPPLHRPETYAHGFPYDVFRDLRDHDPVSHQEHPLWERGYWAVTRHADVQRVSRDWNGFHNAPNPFLPGDGELVDASGSSLLMISLDPPDHTKVRKLISSGFTPRRINDLAVQVKARVDSVIDTVAERALAAVAAADLGSPPWRSFVQVTLPLSLPGIATGCMLVFILLMGEFLIPAMLGGGKVFFVGNALVDLFLQSRNWPFGAAVAVALVGAVVGVCGEQVPVDTCRPLLAPAVRPITLGTQLAASRL